MLCIITYTKVKNKWLCVQLLLCDLDWVTEHTPRWDESKVSVFAAIWLSKLLTGVDYFPNQKKNLHWFNRYIEMHCPLRNVHYPYKQRIKRSGCVFPFVNSIMQRHPWLWIKPEVKSPEGMCWVTGTFGLTSQPVIQHQHIWNLIPSVYCFSCRL